jgi:multidrug resistance efflux pump
LRKRYEPKLARLRDRIARAEDKVEREQEQYKEKKAQSVISIGSTLLGALFGRKLASSGNMGRAATAARGMSRAARERGDIGRAEERMEALAEQLDAMEAQFQDDLDALELSAGTSQPEVEDIRVALRKADLEIAPLSLVWIPYCVDADGIAEPAGGI